VTVRAKQHSLMLGNLRFNVGETARSRTSTSAVSAVVTSCLEKVIGLEGCAMLELIIKMENHSRDGILKYLPINVCSDQWNQSVHCTDWLLMVIKYLL
jgi:hypothetical protein